MECSYTAYLSWLLYLFYLFTSEVTYLDDLAFLLYMVSQLHEVIYPSIIRHSVSNYPTHFLLIFFSCTTVDCTPPPLPHNHT